jgi:predicted Zn-dependent peptidase
VNAVHKELAKLQDELLSERRLKAAKKQLLGQLAISSDNGENLVVDQAERTDTVTKTN